jgi:hypothetical protein
MDSTLHGGEIKKIYNALREFGDVLMNFKYLGKYFKIYEGMPNYDLMHERFARDSIEQNYDAVIKEGEALMSKLEYHLRDMQTGKLEQELHMLGDK